jgi:membrane protein YqaA with SNARE-associated domain
MSEIAVPRSRPRVLTNRRLAWLFVVTVLVAVVALFVADNYVIVRVRILTLDRQVRLAWVMLSTLLIGLAIGGLAGWLLGRGRS